MSEQTKTNLYGLFVALMVLAVCIAYARVTTELKIEGEGDATEQQGIYITDVADLSNNGADTANSKVNFYLGTMLDSKVVLGSSSSSSLSYKVTVKNNTDREQVFIGIVKDETNGTIYSNTNIQPNVATVGELAGLEEYVTTIAPGETLTFPVTFAYSGTDTSNTELQSKINFRFREKPIIELSNNEETYTLENIYAGYTPAEYEFTVSNYNQNYTNGVPLTYTLVPTITEGSPLTGKVYDEAGNEVTGSITMPGDGTAVDHTYTLKIEWDSTQDSTEYEGQIYTCELKLTAIPDLAVNADLDDYADYKIEQGFKVEITTCKHTWENGTCTTCGKLCNHTFGAWTTGTSATCATQGTEKRTCSICGYEETKSTGYGKNHNFENDTCTLCGLNYPVMTDDMTPVAWDTSGNEFTPTTDEEWFDYWGHQEGDSGEVKWANAKTSDGSYWVWIPRYEYKITSTTTSTSSAGTIDVRFIPTTTNSSTSGYTTTTAINSTVNGVTVLSKGITVSSDGYIIHPAFTTNLSTGGWKSELPGFWVAKYEMSMETSGAATTTSSATIGNVATSSTIKAVSKPGVTSWRYINISNCYENSMSYDTAKNSHLMKNSEWGAVAYLTHSSYGRNGTEVTINSNSSYYTAGGSGATANTNVAQSSTGNNTGIFDLSGCAYEYIAAFNDKYSSSGDYYSKTSSSYKSASGNNMGATGLVSGSTEYLTAYSNSTAQYYIGQSSGSAYTSHTAFASGGHTVSITGDAIYEVWVSSTSAWFNDYSYFVYSGWPCFERGGYYSRGSAAGVFCSGSAGGKAYSSSSFRVCLAPCKHSYSSGACTKCGAKEPIPTTTSYVGCYADMDADGTIDGVIFADQGVGTTGTGEWGRFRRGL